MKILAAFVTLLLFWSNLSPIMVIDRDFKKPVRYTNNFTPDLYFQRNFPLYSADLDAMIEATDKAAKKIDHGIACGTMDTISANRTNIYISTGCNQPKTISILLVTRIENTQTDYSFELVRKESDMRLAQRKLLDFTTYLTK